MGFMSKFSVGRLPVDRLTVGRLTVLPYPNTAFGLLPFYEQNNMAASLRLVRRLNRRAMRRDRIFRDTTITICSNVSDSLEANFCMSSINSVMNWGTNLIEKGASRLQCKS